jgi:hypothetical protein
LGGFHLGFSPYGLKSGALRPTPYAGFSTVKLKAAPPIRELAIVEAAAASSAGKPMPVETAPVSCDAVASKIFDAGDAENVAAMFYLQKTQSPQLSPEEGSAKGSPPRRAILIKRRISDLGTERQNTLSCRPMPRFEPQHPG